MERFAPADVREFVIDISDAALDDLTRRLAATWWPESFDAPDTWSTGTDEDYLRELVAYWRSDFRWRAQEAELNRSPQFTATVCGAPVHFIHVRGTGPNPLPIVLTHGWPSSFLEMLRLIPYLTDPTRHGGDANDAFHVVVPSVPGYGFSSRTAGPVTAASVADSWAALMSMLGYERFAAHGGDIGSGITTALGYRHPERVVGMHLLAVRDVAIDGNTRLTKEEESYLNERAEWIATEGAYSHLQQTKPQTLAYALNDSPVGFAAWVLEKFRAWSDSCGSVETCFSKDWLLTTITLYWVTETIHSSIRYYFDNARWGTAYIAGARIPVPCAVALFPKDLLHPPRHWAERLYDVHRWTVMPRGGHFAAHEQPQLLAADLRAFFRTLR